MLGRENLDRDAASRTRDGHIEAVMAHPQTRVLAIRASRAPYADGQLVFLQPSQVPVTATLAYLGKETEGTTAYVAAFVEDDAEIDFDPAAAVWADLRVIGPELSDRDSGLFSEAVALFHWHRAHEFSPKTGEGTVSGQSGWVRANHEGESQVFPRTDPAVIVLVTDDNDRILLGNNALWEANRFSLLAGYVEPGESLESAVVREVYEESGLRVVDPSYLGSQPWPFPGSVMMGFSARLAPGEHPENHAADGEEILSLKWFTRDELKAAVDDIKLPGRVAIARAMIEHWLGETIDQESGWRGTR